MTYGCAADELELMVFRVRRVIALYSLPFKVVVHRDGGFAVEHTTRGRGKDADRIRSREIQRFWDLCPELSGTPERGNVSVLLQVKRDAPGAPPYRIPFYDIAVRDYGGLFEACWSEPNASRAAGEPDRFYGRVRRAQLAELVECLPAFWFEEALRALAPRLGLPGATP